MTAVATKEVVYVEPCLTCGRELVEVYSDGSFNLASKAGVVLQFEFDRRGVPVNLRGEPKLGTSRDLRWSCRVRKWWRARSAAIPLRRLWR